MALDQVGICNQALGQLPAEAISGFDERSVAAEWCARSYGPALEYLLEMHDWKFPRVRAQLAPLVNDRPGEWAYAYQVPINSSAELRVLSPADVSGNPPPILAGLVVGPTRAYLVPTQWLAYSYLLAGSVLYTNVQDAILEYIPNAPNEQTFSALFTHAFVLELASRICMPVKQDRVRQGDLIKMAELARDRAIADARNRDNSDSTYGNFEPNVQLARDGWGTDAADWYGWVTR